MRKKIVLLSCLQLVVQFATFGENGFGAALSAKEVDTKADTKSGQVMSQQSNDQSLKWKIEAVSALIADLQQLKTVDDKISYLGANEIVSLFLKQNPQVASAILERNSGEQLAFLQLLALNQGPVVFDGMTSVANTGKAMDRLAAILISLDQFYQSLGGILGYHRKVLQLMDEQINPSQEGRQFYAPPFYDIRDENELVKENILAGIKAQEHMGELYAVGGAGDRLDLHHPMTGIPLPAARLPFYGKSLLHTLVTDLQAREYLFYKLYHKQLRTPIVLMTSEEKNNDYEMAAILEEASWFGRSKESFLRIVQPQTPVITVDGSWAISGPLDLIVKPGGHGVIWKLIKDKGGFNWLKEQQRDFLLVRQINNPIAGVDYGLLAPVGLGWSKQKAFGFASCKRLPGASEGVNVLMEKKDNQAFLNTVTNIEYTDFARHAASLQKELPANTNILFANIDAVEKAAERLPIPGMIVNMKHEVLVWQGGKTVAKKGARLESTMQNIADAIVDVRDRSFGESGTEPTSTFVTMNNREKTISVAKKASDGKSIFETPDGAYYDIIKENLRLLESCNFLVPDYSSEKEYLAIGPQPLFIYHPSMGPLYSIIRQKIRGGSLTKGSELVLDIAEIDMQNVNIDGSLLVSAEYPVGKRNGDGVVEYSDQCGKCKLYNVTVQNSGIDRSAGNTYWQNKIERKGALKISLLGHSEFEASDVVFTNSMEIVVPDGKRMIARAAEDGSVEFQMEDIGPLSWHWNYSASDKAEIILSQES